MTFNESLKKNTKMIKGLKAIKDKLEWSKENEKIMRDFMLKVLDDAGFIPLELLISTFWKIEE